jgi:hypothetical protein
VSVYVVFRSSHPDEETLTDVLKKLQNNNIGINQLAEFRANHCQQITSTTEGESYE